jgi:hypothetical protein
MSRVPLEPRSWPAKAVGEKAAAELRRQIEAVKAKVEAHREVMQLAGLTSAPPVAGADPDR